MLDVTPENLRNEIEAAQSLRKKHTDLSAELIRRYAGESYRSDWSGDRSGDNFDAHEFEYVVNMVPSLIYNNPSVEVKGLVPVLDDVVARALEAAYPQWIESVGFASRLSWVGMDVQFDFGVVLTGLDILPGYENTTPPYPLWPMVYRVSPRRFFTDPRATSRFTRRYDGHVWVKDKDDLLNDPNYDPAAVALMTPDVDMETARASVEKTGDGGKVKRNEVVGYELWVRDTNMIYTLGVGSTGAKFLREPRPWRGCPKNGPYTIFGVYGVPDQIYPLPALAVTAALVKELNAHRSAASASAGTAKTIVAYDTMNPEAKKAITTSVNGDVVGIPGLSSAVQKIEIGGAGKDQLEYIQVLQQLLDRQSGLTEIIRGNITGATATETELAQQSADVRSRFARNQFRMGVKEVLENVGYFFVNDEEVKFYVDVEGTPMMFVGGVQDGQDPAAHDRLSVEIEPYSMEMVDQGIIQRRSAAMVQYVTQAGPIMPQTPWIKWKDVTDDFGESMNVRNAGDRYFDFNVLQQVTLAGLMQQAQQSQMGADQHQQRMQEPPRRALPAGRNGQ